MQYFIFPCDEIDIRYVSTLGSNNKIKPSSAMKSVSISLHTGALRRMESILRRREAVCSDIDTYSVSMHQKLYCKQQTTALSWGIKTSTHDMGN